MKTGLFDGLEPEAWKKTDRSIENQKDDVDRFIDALTDHASAIRALTKDIPVIGNVVNTGYELEATRELDKWVSDWKKNTNRVMAYPILSKGGQIPNITGGMAEGLYGALYKPPNKTQRRL